MTSSGADWLRPALLLIPAVIAVLSLAMHGQTTPRRAGAFMAYVWQFQTRLIVNMVAINLGLWHFNSTGGALYGVPVDIIIGQTLLFGSTLVLWHISRHPWLIALPALGFDVLLMANASSLFVAHSHWVAAIVVINLLAVVPSLVLGEATATDTRLKLRASMQAVCWLSLLGWLFPSIIFASGFGSWDLFLARPLSLNLLLLLPLIIPGAILGSALYEFADKGGGTAFPYDPPQTLVVTGIYAYVSNPMQLGVCLFMTYWGFVLGSQHVSLIALVAVMLFIVFKDICNGSSAIGATNLLWVRYHREVPRWIPRLRAWVA